MSYKIWQRTFVLLRCLSILLGYDGYDAICLESKIFIVYRQGHRDGRYIRPARLLACLALHFTNFSKFFNYYLYKISRGYFEFRDIP